MQPNSRSFDTVRTNTGTDIELLDFTNELQLDEKIMKGKGSIGVVYRCPCKGSGVVAVKAVTPPADAKGVEREKLRRALRRELGIWKRLDHPNIVPLLGKTSGIIFGSHYDCMVSVWMPHGTLDTYIKNGEMLTPSRRMRIVTDVTNGLNYLHSKGIVHGDFHPGNVLIDGEGNARLTDFGLSQVFLPEDDSLSYLWTTSVHHGAPMWAAPERVFPKLYPEWNDSGKPRATPNGDIYSLGSVILFILSGNMPWPNVVTAYKRLEKRQTPRRRDFSAIHDDVWSFVTKCWSPKKPGARPTAQEAVSCISNNFQGVQIKPYVVVIFGRTGVGISSLVNLIVGHPISNDHTAAKPSKTSKRVKPYPPITLPGSENRFHLYEIPGFGGQFTDATILETIRRIERNVGVDLFIYCLRSQKWTIMTEIVRIIRSIVPGKKFPMIAAVTELERFDAEGGTNDWWDLPLKDGNTNGMLVEQMCFGKDDEFDAHACITTLPPGEAAQTESWRGRRKQSEARVRKLIIELCARGERREVDPRAPSRLQALAALLDLAIPWL